MSWYMGADGYPTNDQFPELPTVAMAKPYPKALFRTDLQTNNGYPFHELLPEVPLLGAFANANNLSLVRIPNTVKSIGENSFTFTKLTSVQIASDCEYYDTSFPEGCIVKRTP